MRGNDSEHLAVLKSLVPKHRQKLAREPLSIEKDETPTQIRNAAPRPSLNRRAEFKSWVASPTFGYNPRRLLMASGLP